ncbi:MAG: methylmalonyl Co-A mutase-associated GTPase MeaB [Stellaceae bacterium]
MAPRRSDPLSLAEAVLNGDRAALARAITLVESTRADDRDAAEKLLARLLPRAGGAIRLGISGAPGVGKSTFIEAFGLMLIEAGHRVAVLAVDPSSKRAGGSILGDKTRMARLSQSDAAFIRPSPAGKSIGGVARRTRDATLLAAAAGFDIVVVETVGVGQSETAVADMVDLFLLLIAPGGGDDLQGIKKGIVELADLIVVNKDDGDLAAAAKRAVADYRHALRLLAPADSADAVDALAVSALERRGLDKVWSIATKRIAAARASGGFDERRARQAQAALWREIGDGLLDLFRADSDTARLLRGLESKVAAGKLTPSAAARQALEAFRG